MSAFVVIRVSFVKIRGELNERQDQDSIGSRFLGRSAHCPHRSGHQGSDRLHDDGLPRRGDDVYHAKTEDERPFARLREGPRALDGENSSHTY